MVKMEPVIRPKILDRVSNVDDALIGRKQLCGAEEAYWAHNPGVSGSKPLGASYSFLPFPPFYQRLLCMSTTDLYEFLHHRSNPKAASSLSRNDENENEQRR